ncbi:MAG TPA: VWA domain-containing protein [Candidatus Acidoferrum sp.]
MQRLRLICFVLREGKHWAAMLGALLILCTSSGARAQDTGTGAGSSAPAASGSQSGQGTAGSEASAKAQSDTKSEISTQDTGTTFKLRVNLVQVHVTVRDGKGNPIPNLKREDFQVFDQGKLQPITVFAVETRESRKEKALAAAKTQADASGPGESKTVLPDRFVAMQFDDIHLAVEDAVYTRKSAEQFLESLAPTDRVGIFTTSGEVTQDFTGDVALLKRTLLGIIPRPKVGHTSTSDCPDVSPYVADLVQNRNDQMAFQAVVNDAWQCAYNNDPLMRSAAVSLAQSTIPRVAMGADADNNYTYRTLQDTLRRLAAMPGERVMLMVSPGFIMGLQTSDMLLVVDQANHANIVINTLDARGLYTPDMGDISRQRTGIAQLGQYRIAAQTEQAYVLADFAYGTGGAFFQNSNDIAGGMKMIGSAPEVSYVIGFSPQNEKMDGSFHSLKVKLTSKEKYTIQARRGYYAPRKLNDPKEQEKQEIQEAIFSRDEIMDLPLELQTQYFKKDAAEAQLSVVSRLQVRGMHFRTADGRHNDSLTFATAIFDDNGNFVIGGEKILQMRLLDPTYEKVLRTGLVLKSSFDLKPGKYMVRQVVRDSEGSQMAARNGAVDIPY